jgi:hypothetical protein
MIKKSGASSANLWKGKSSGYRMSRKFPTHHLSRPITQLSQCNYYLEGYKYPIISYIDDVRSYATHNHEKIITMDMTLTLYHFARWKNRSKYLSLNSSSSKALASKSFAENWLTYSDLQFSYLVKSKSGVPASMRTTFHAQTNADMVILLTFWRKLSPISLRSFLLGLQELLRNISLSLNQESKRSSNESLKPRDSPKGQYHIRSQTLISRSESTGDWPVERPPSRQTILFLVL